MELIKVYETFKTTRKIDSATLEVLINKKENSNYDLIGSAIKDDEETQSVHGSLSYEVEKRTNLNLNYLPQDQAIADSLKDFMREVLSEVLNENTENN